MTERERDRAFREGYWTGRLDALLSRSAHHAAGEVFTTKPGTYTHHFSHGYVVGLRDARMEMANGDEVGKEVAS